MAETTASTESAARLGATESPLAAALAAPETAPVACVNGLVQPPSSGGATAAKPTRIEAFTAAHLQRLEGICAERNQPAAHEVQRGLAVQQVLRELEQSIRRGVLDFCRQATAQGLSQQEQSAWLTLSPRTLRSWEHAWQNGGLAVKARGRPLLCANRDERQQVVHFLHQLGPGTGLAVVQGEFPELARAELQDLLRCFRWAWIGEHARLLHQLHWRGPGRIWAMDYAESRCLIDGCYRYVLAVRDLASGQQLLWQPLREATAASTIEQLTWLFALYGAPLVLKSDNGSPFSAEDTRDFLRDHGVCQLFSPPLTPSYNGSCEAAIGSMKKRTVYQAERQGHGGQWTSTDLQTARQQANETARPRGPKGPTPAQAWQQRTPLGTVERRLFADTVARLQGEVRRHKELPRDQELTHRQEAEVQREVLRRALVAHGYLWFTRRRIPIPIRRQKGAKIM